MSWKNLVCWMALIVPLSLLLYHTADRVKTTEDNLRHTRIAIEEERQNLHILAAEWAYLTDPTRLETLAAKHLPLQPLLAAQLGDFPQLAMKLDRSAPVQVAQAAAPAPAVAAPAKMAVAAPATANSKPGNALPASVSVLLANFRQGQ